MLPPSAPAHQRMDQVQEAQVNVSFEVRAKTNWGDTVVIVGNTAALGNWDAERGLPLSTNGDCYPLWHAKAIALPPCEYKVVILRAEGESERGVEWEPLAGNRCLSFDLRGGAQQLRVSVAWGDAATLDWGPSPSRAAVGPAVGAPSSHLVPSTPPTRAATTPRTAQPIPSAEQLIKTMPARGQSPRNNMNVMPPPCNSFSLPEGVSWAHDLVAEQQPSAHIVPAVLVGAPLDRIDSCDGSWTASEHGSSRSMASCASRGGHTPSDGGGSAVDLASLTMQSRALAPRAAVC